MSKVIKRLPVHPLPRSGEKITLWIDTLAKANSTDFFILITYVKKFIKDSGLVNTLNDLTGLSIEQISKLNNDLNSKYWENPNQCLFKNCDYKAKENSTLKRHLVFKHDIGVTWHKCPHCDYKAKNKMNLKRHLANRHDIGVVWYECPH